MVFFAGLILLQFRKVFMEAEECNFESLAALNGVCDRGPTNNQPVALDAVQFLQLPEFADEGVFVLLGDLGTEFEQDCRSDESQH